MAVITENKFVPKLRFNEFSGEWNTKKLGDIADVSKLAGFEFTEHIKYSDTGNIIALRGLNIKSNGLNLTNVKYIDNSNFSKLSRSKLYIDDMMFTYVGTIGETAIIKENDRFYLAPNVSRIRLKDDKNSIVFVNHYFNNSRFRNVEIVKYIATSSQPALSMSNIRLFCLPLPSKQEQQKIASFLSAVDKKLQQLTKKKELLEEYKKGIMQKIFSQELRFKDEFNNNYPDWEEKKLGEELEHKSIRNKSNQVDLVLSVSNKKGFISQQEQFDGHQVASKDVTNYKVVNKGEYAYNPSRINVGSIARLDDFEKGIVSPMYVIFRLKNNLNPIFFDALYSSHRFKYLIKIGCSGSVRDSLNFDELEKFDIKLPCIEEQQKIANFLSILNKKIDLVSTQIENTKAFKKGLLQQMFV